MPRSHSYIHVYTCVMTRQPYVSIHLWPCTYKCIYVYTYVRNGLITIHVIEKDYDSCSGTSSWGFVMSTKLMICVMIVFLCSCGSFGVVIRVTIRVIKKDYGSCSGTSSWGFVMSKKIVIRVMIRVLVLLWFFSFYDSSYDSCYHVKIRVVL